MKYILSIGIVVCLISGGLSYTISPPKTDMVLQSNNSGQTVDNSDTKDFVFSGHTIIGYTGEEQDLVIPDYIRGEEVKYIDYDVSTYYEGAYKVKNLTLSKNIVSIKTEFMTCFNQLQNINVPKDNPVYASIDGILYNKEKTELIYCPAGRQGKVSNLPESLKSIGESAFWSCTNITEVELPEGVERIDAYTFGCSRLTGIKLPESLTSIGNCAFRNCSELNNINMPKNLKSIEKETFRGCVSLTDFEMPENLESLDEDIFVDCYSLTNISISADNSLYESENGILYSKGKSELVIYPPGKQAEEFELPESVMRIGLCAFQRCKNITTVKLPEGLTSIGKYAFTECSNLSELELPESVNDIGEGAFWSCDNLIDINIPEGIREVKEHVFTNCSGLKSISLPGTLTDIGKSAFAGCECLTDINYPKDKTAWDSQIHISEYGNEPLDAADFHYTQIGTEQSEDTATEKKAVQVRDIEEYDKVTYFTEGVWRGCLDHDSQTVRISGCEGAKISLEIPDVLWDKPVKGIGGYAFEDMKMENVTIPENIEDIDPNAFAGCENLTDIYVAESNPIYSSGDGILYNKEKTELIICPRGRQGEISNLPSSLKVIGHSSFSQCENLTSIHLPNGVVGIGGYAFYGCSMESIMLPDSLEYIQDSAFKLCWQLETIHIPSKVKSIDSGTVFYSCNNLKAIDVS